MHEYRKHYATLMGHGKKICCTNIMHTHSECVIKDSVIFKNERKQHK